MITRRYAIEKILKGWTSFGWTKLGELTMVIPEAGSLIPFVSKWVYWGSTSKYFAKRDFKDSLASA
jgi:hypothetical protein